MYSKLYTIRDDLLTNGSVKKAHFLVYYLHEKGLKKMNFIN